MTQLLRQRGLPIAGLLIALAIVAVWVLMPPAARETAVLDGGPPTARGAYHVHSDRSDGSGTVDAIAAAAQRAGLQFVVLTDHGDGTRQPEAPHYRSGVLVIDAVELNTSGGHLVALGLPAAPYPFAGTAADVLEDVHRLGGFGIAAHPDSPRPSLRWTGDDSHLDGIEWINADSSWRDESAMQLSQTILGFGFRGPASMAALSDRPVGLLARWDEMGEARDVSALAAADAHARMGFRQTDDPGTATVHLPLPGYETTFRTFSNHVVLDQPLTTVAATDASAVLDALTKGRSFTIIDGLATPGGLEFTAEVSGRGVARIGDSIPLEANLTVRARISGPAGATLRIMRNGRPVQATGEAELSVRAEAGVYRVEAHTAGAPGSPPVPWLLSNAIYVGLTHARFASTEPPAPMSRIPARSADVATESGNGDVSELVDAQLDDARARRLAGEPPISWRFALAPGVPAGQFAAVQLPVTGGLAAFDRVRFLVKSSRPMRAWVQVRAGGATERWGRTFYTDTNTRIVDLPLRSFLRMGSAPSAAAPLDRVDSLLVVIDTLNNRPGAAGTMTIAEIAFVR